MQFTQIVGSVLGVFLIIGIGAFCRSQKWLSREADFSLAKITANVLMPALFLDRILNDDSLDALSTAWVPPVFGFGLTTCGLLLAWAIARCIGPWMGLKTDAQQRAFAICAGIANYGYIPLPLSQIFYPSAEVELILHNVGVDLALWSVGIAIISGGNSPVHAAEQPSAPPPRGFLRLGWMGKILRALTSAPLIAVAIALSIRTLGWDTLIPSSLMKSIHLLAGASIPMGLLLSGAIIIDFLRAAQWTGAAPVIFLSIGFRQLLMPVIMLSVAGAWAIQTDMKHVLLLQAAMSSAVFPIVLTRLYHGDTATALRVVLSTSLAGLVLIPIWISLGAWWLGV
ncbi:AEC family transporter [Allorhodopirellula solitaria]